jgi:hypothetical protein
VPTGLGVRVRSSGGEVGIRLVDVTRCGIKPVAAQPVGTLGGAA